MDAVELDELLSHLSEIEELLRFPNVNGHRRRAEALALYIARNAPTSVIHNLAMQVITEAALLRPSALPLQPSDGKLYALLQNLRLAMQNAKSHGGQ